MKLKLILLWMISVVFISCNERQNAAKTKNPEFRISEIKQKNSTPTVAIEQYNLVVNPSEDRQADAEQILNVKRAWPRVMQHPTIKGFDSILSKDFTFIDHGKIFSRENYIKDRTKPSEWKITFVKYDNLSLQFFGNKALLTYRNHVKNENSITKVIEIEHINWADVYTKEDGKWKIISAHVIDITVEEKK